MTSKKNFFLELRTAFKPKENSYKVSQLDTRTLEYVTGLKRFFSLLESRESWKSLNIDIYLVDNTITSKNDIPKQILDVIPDYVNFILFDENEYGKINKGAGLISAWLHNKETLKEYEWLMYFEPRLFLVDFNFLNNFLDNPRNLFSVNETLKCFNTGMFCAKTDEIIKYSNSVNIISFIGMQISIEYDLYNFFMNQSIDFDQTKELGVIWKNSLINQEIYM